MTDFESLGLSPAQLVRMKGTMEDWVKRRGGGMVPSKRLASSWLVQGTHQDGERRAMMTGSEESLWLHRQMQKMTQ